MSDIRKTAQILDSYDPGWYKKINVDILNLDSCRYCILGQLFENTRTVLAFTNVISTLKKLGYVSDNSFGMTQNEDGVDENTPKWLAEIQNRKDAEKEFHTFIESNKITV